MTISSKQRGMSRRDFFEGVAAGLVLSALDAYPAHGVQSHDATLRSDGNWPPALDTHNAVIRSTDGRLIQRYVHGPRQEWGYPATADAEWAYPKAQETGAKEQNHNSFYVVSPLKPREGAPSTLSSIPRIAPRLITSAMRSSGERSITPTIRRQR